MPFPTTGSVISTDLDNMLRGIYRDNSDSALTGTLVETTLKSVSIAANTIGPTGALHVVFGGKITGTAGTKIMKLKFGGTIIATTSDSAASVLDWYFDAWCLNTATNAQRWIVHLRQDSAVGDRVSFQTSVIDTTQNQTLLVTGQLGNVGDTLTATIFDVFVVQIT